MIVPPGAAIEHDARGRLCLRTPGNLVLQGSGTYGELESVNGSIRIEAGIRVEAAVVRCAEVCSVGGHLQAWKIVAKELQVEAGAEAAFVLRDTKALSVDPKGRVIGNFVSEGELVGLFSRFAHEIRGLPANAKAASLAAVLPTPDSGERPHRPLRELVPLLEAARHGEDGARGRILDELIRLTSAEDRDTLRATWRVLFERLEPLGDSLETVKLRLEDVFESRESRLGGSE
jgi:hypothetical protein